jgi:hypothetical protein
MHRLEFTSRDNRDPHIHHYRFAHDRHRRDDHDLAANFPDDDYDLAGGTHPRGDC